MGTGVLCVMCACVHSTSIVTTTNPQECTVINIHVQGVLLGNAHTAKFVKIRMLTPLDNRMLSTVRLHLDLLTLHACVHPLVAVEIKKKNSLGCVVGESLGLPHIGRVGAGGRQDDSGGGRERIKL